jgi:hypothetical protein
MKSQIEVTAQSLNGITGTSSGIRSKKLRGSSCDRTFYESSERKFFVVNQFLVLEMWENRRMGSSGLLRKINDMQVPALSLGDS